VADGTLTRGRLTTLTDMWGLPEVRRRPLMVCLIIAALIHLPAVPSHFSTWVRMLFGNAEELESGPQQEFTIPIELDIGIVDDEVREQSDDPGGSEAKTEEAGQGEPDEDLSGELLDDDDDGEDAKADAGTDEPDAGETDSDTPDAGTQEVDAGTEAPTGPIEDPYDVAGGAAGVGAKDPNVRIYIAADVLRQRTDLAKMFGELLNSVPEWKDLLGGTKLNPIEDFDHMLISGPQLRNPQWIWAAVEYNVSSQRMRQAVDQVVRQSPEGKWEDEEGMPVAAIGPNGERRVVLLSDRRLLVVLPAEEADRIHGLKDLKPFKKSGRVGIGVFVITPWRAFKSPPFVMPKSIKWMRIRFTLEGAEDFNVELEVEDESEDAARKHGADLERQIEALRPVPGISLFVKKEFIGKPSWEIDGKRIRMRAPASKEQVRRIMRLIREVVLPPLIAKRNKAAPKSSAPPSNIPPPSALPAPQAPVKQGPGGSSKNP
jgi:hypothetical protein